MKYFIIPIEFFHKTDLKYLSEDFDLLIRKGNLYITLENTEMTEKDLELAMNQLGLQGLGKWITIE